MARIARWVPMAALAILLAAPTGADAQQAFTPDQLSELPSIKSVTQAQRAISRSYPRALMDAGIEGRVQLRFVVGADGKVDPSSIEVVAASQKAFGEAAAEAIAKIEFKPGKKDGSPVAAVVVMPISYNVS